MNSFVKKKILVTGGAGFIGSHLCEELSKNSSNEIFSLDNYFTGSVNNHIKNVNYIKGSTNDIAKLIQFEPDLIYHLGEYSRVEQSFHDIEQVFDFNTQGTFAVLEFVRRTNAKLIYSGSSTKFADNGIGGNQSPYAWTKSSNTKLIINYGEWFDIKYAITYFYNAYGGREISEGRHATLIGIFKEKMRKKLPLDVVKPGSQKRNFTHIDDIILGLILVGEKGKGDGYGIGCSSSYSVLEIAKMFGAEINFIPEREGNRMTAEVFTSRTEELGWESTIAIEDYIKGLKADEYK
jgi:UDP-glucose 4-epimerase